MNEVCCGWIITPLHYMCIYIYVFTYILCDSATGEPQAGTAATPSATAAAAHSNQCPPSMCLCYVVC